jgi:hypothetical protein
LSQTFPIPRVDLLDHERLVAETLVSVLQSISVSIPGTDELIAVEHGKTSGFTLFQQPRQLPAIGGNFLFQDHRPFLRLLFSISCKIPRFRPGINHKQGRLGSPRNAANSAIRGRVRIIANLSVAIRARFGCSRPTPAADKE